MSKVFGSGRVAVLAILIVGLATPTALLAQRVRDGRNRQNWAARSDDEDRGPKETEQVDRTIPLPSNGTLHLKNFSGDIRIVASATRDIVVKATRRATRERLDHIKLDISTSGSTVTIDANKRDAEWSRQNRNNNVVETTFEIQVPTSANLDVDAFSSDVTVEGVTGEQKLQTFNGEIEVLNPRAAVDAETFSGDIRVTVSRDARGNVSFDTFSGEVDTTLPISTTSWRKRSVEGTLPGGSGPRMKFHTFSGDLRINSR